MGRLQESIHEFSEAISINPSYLEARINLGLALSQNSDPAGAANIFQEILKQNPGMPEIHNNLGLVLMQSRIPELSLLSKRRYASSRTMQKPTITWVWRFFRWERRRNQTAKSRKLTNWRHTSGRQPQRNRTGSQTPPKD